MRLEAHKKGSRPFLKQLPDGKPCYFSVTTVTPASPSP